METANTSLCTLLCFRQTFTASFVFGNVGHQVAQGTNKQIIQILLGGGVEVIDFASWYRGKARKRRNRLTSFQE